MAALGEPFHEGAARVRHFFGCVGRERPGDQAARLCVIGFRSDQVSLDHGEFVAVDGADSEPVAGMVELGVDGLQVARVIARQLVQALAVESRRREEAQQQAGAIEQRRTEL